MKTTLIIPDQLIAQLKTRAADTNRTLSDVVSETLRKGLLREPPKRTYRKLPSFNCGEVKVDVADRDQLYRVMEGK